MNRKARLEVDGLEVTLPVIDGTAGPSVIDVTSVYGQIGYFLYDPGFFSTTSCSSSITFIDGAKGLLSYRGHSVVDLVKNNASFMEVVQLLLFGEVLGSDDSSNFSKKILDEMVAYKCVMDIVKSFDSSAHPMAMLIACFASIAGMFHEEFDSSDINGKLGFCMLAISQIAVFVAMIFRHKHGLNFPDFARGSSYCAKFFSMMFPETECNTKFINALETILILHADHEQNASTSSMRLTGSTGADVFACLSSAVAALWGPAHGGANEAVIKMLESVRDEFSCDVEKFISSIKSSKSSQRLMGFGHRIYRNYDPRSLILKDICGDIINSIGTDQDDKLFELALKLERVALEDEYFISRSLYPNVDFYSGLILKALGIDTEMFTLIFALARTAGWVSQWYEMVSDKFKIWRPRQLYLGATHEE